MRENRTHGSEGGDGESRFRPLSDERNGNMKSEVVNSERSDRTVDAFTAEVIRSAVVAITGEMKTNLMRTAYHTIIYEAEDFTVGLFDADGNTISIGLGLPMFIRGLSDSIKAKIEFWGKENIEPGDILLTNDSYTMGSHLNHLIFTLPIFQRWGADRVFLFHGALAGHRWAARRGDPRYFFRGAADPFRKNFPRRQRKS